MNFEPLRALMETLVAEGVPGCELAVCRGHKVLFHECAGFSDAARLRPATPFDRYLLCSCTKPVTAVAAMQCLERDLIALDDPVEKYLPHWANVRVRDGETLRAPRTAPTVRHLLTMTAGLDYNLNRPWLADFSEGSAREIAEAIAPQFPDTDLDVLEAVCQRHLDIDAWNETPVMKEESLNRLMDVMEGAGQLEARVAFDDLVDNSWAEKAQ